MRSFGVLKAPQHKCSIHISKDLRNEIKKKKIELLSCFMENIMISTLEYLSGLSDRCPWPLASAGRGTPASPSCI